MQMPGQRWSRRQFLARAAGAGGGLVALAGSGYVGHVWPNGPSKSNDISETAADISDVFHFVSRADLQPPRVTVSRAPRAAKAVVSAAPPPYVVVSPKGYTGTGPGQQGLMMLDRQGDLVWFLPKLGSTADPFDLQVQAYQGQPVLTWWQGTVVPAGYGEGSAYIMDSTYRQIAQIQAGNGLRVDLHEFNLTPQGTALVTAYKATTTDLSAVGGAKAGKVLSCQAQEVDVASGQLLFSWDCLDHVPVTESNLALSHGSAAPYDYFHMNSIALATDGDLLISSRNTWTVYKVSRTTGEIVWRLNGKLSDFSMGTGSHFYWQHHVRAISDTKITIFDDGSDGVLAPNEPQSRGIVLDVDTKTKKATLSAAYTHPTRLLAANQGSMQYLDSTHAFVGWGDQPYFSELDAEGTLLFDGRFPANDQSYRAFAVRWTGHPTDDPALVVKASTTGGVTFYVSWNGATEVETWKLLAGTAGSSLAQVGTALRTGFETVITVNSNGPFYAAAALDAGGNQLAQSETVRLS